MLSSDAFLVTTDAGELSRCTATNPVDMWNDVISSDSVFCAEGLECRSCPEDARNKICTREGNSRQT